MALSSSISKQIEHMQSVLASVPQYLPSSVSSAIEDSSLVTKIAGGGALAILARLGYLYFFSPLRDFRGPFFAKFTDLWRLYDYYCCTQIESNQKLHDKHGVAVRIGPNMVTLNDPELIKVVYPTRGDFVKSEFYEVADATAEGYRIENVFSTRSNAFHSKFLKPYQKYFSNTKILEKEVLTDRIFALMCEQLESRYVDGPNAGKTVDLAEWIEYGAWDLDWEMTFSQDMGFLKTGSDVDGMIHTGEATMRYLGVVGQMPWLDRWLGKNPHCPVKFATFSNVAYYCFQRVMERVQNPREKSNEDFLDNFIAAKAQYPDVVTDNEVVSYLMMNVLAGADTTAIVQKAILYHILSNPEVHEKVNAELDAAGLSFPPQYGQLKDLPYLSACIREGERMHPVISGILERIVPARGLPLPDGRVIPAGTKVGINAWVAGRNKKIYGADADKFNPERWLQAKGESDEEFQARVGRMKECDFTFGAGSRQCVGRHLATMNLYKQTATLLHRYNITLTNDKQFVTRWWWFTFTDYIHVKLERRN